jgi:ankyrin repeat protein
MQHKLTREEELLFESCKAGNRNAALIYMAHVSDIDVRCVEGWTPLIVASYNGFTDIIVDLITHGANVNATNRNGTSVLMYAKSAAVRTGDYSGMDVLLEHKADPYHRDLYGKTIFDYAKTINDSILLSYLSLKMNRKNNLD